MEYFIKRKDMQIVPPDWLVTDLFTKNSLGAIFGPSGNGKTFIALNLAFSVASGMSFHSHDVQQGDVVYIAGEGLSGLLKRIRALELYHKTPVVDRLLISNGPLPIGTPGWVERIIDDIGDNARPSLIVIDTLARNFGSGDENSTSDMGRFIKAIDTLRLKYSCTILLVHHTGHSTQDRGRGSSSLTAALDHEYKVSRDKSTNIIRVDTTKVKDFGEHPPMAFKLESFSTEIPDVDGNFITSAILKGEKYSAPVVEKGKTLGKNQKLALEKLQELQRNYEEETTSPGEVQLSEWKQACNKGGIDNKRFPETKQSLLEAGMIEIDGSSVRTCPSD